MDKQDITPEDVAWLTQQAPYGEVIQKREAGRTTRVIVARNWTKEEIDKAKLAIK